MVFTCLVNFIQTFHSPYVAGLSCAFKDVGSFISLWTPFWGIGVNIFKFPFSFSILYINICNWDSNNVSDSGMFGLLYVYSTCPCLGLLALWLLAFFLVIAINQYGFLFPRHCDLGGALEGVGCFWGGVRALGLDHLAGGLRSLLWVVVALLRWHLVLVCLGRLSLGFALAPPAYPV